MSTHRFKTRATPYVIIAILATAPISYAIARSKPSYFLSAAMIIAIGAYLASGTPRTSGSQLMQRNVKIDVTTASSVVLRARSVRLFGILPTGRYIQLVARGSQGQRITVAITRNNKPQHATDDLDAVAATLRTKPTLSTIADTITRLARSTPDQVNEMYNQLRS